MQRTVLACNQNALRSNPASGHAYGVPLKSNVERQLSGGQVGVFEGLLWAGPCCLAAGFDGQVCCT